MNSTSNGLTELPESVLIVASWKIHDNNIGNIDFLGNKAIGLLKLPIDWVPSFLILTKEFYNKWIETKDALNILANLPLQSLELLNDFLSKVIYPKIIVRSNSPLEGIDERGKYQSYTVKKNLKDIANVINTILQDAFPDKMYIILQAAISPSMLGHISNERRLSHLPSKWFIEWNNGNSQKFIITNNRHVDGPLLARNEKELINVLRNVANNFIMRSEDRYHCEWIWSGKQLWIVQADLVPKLSKGINIDGICKGSNASLSEKIIFQVIKHFLQIDAKKWKKLRSPMQFHMLGLPISNIYVLTGESWNKELLALIEEDLTLMCKVHPFVIRCDISSTLDKSDLLLPTSNPIDNVKDGISYMSAISDKFKNEGFADTEWTFLIAHLFDIKASALVHALPNTQRIRIDTIWGYPDGLLYYPHDTHYFYTATKKIVNFINWKGSCLVQNEKGWEHVFIDEPHDWKQILNIKEIALIADWALRLSNKLNKEIQLMIFAKMNNLDGLKGCLPWHYTDLPVQQYTGSVKSIPLTKQIKVIDSRESMDELRHAPIQNTYKGILIQPAPKLLRDDLFIKESAALALELKIPIYYQGSLLSHAYYIMNSTGATVIPVTRDEPKESAITYNKLVRDKIPLIIKQAGGIARVKTLNKDEAVTLLSQKIVEEALEVWNSKDNEELIQELADVFEVIEALQNFIGCTKEQFNNLRQAKVEKRGGFENLIYLEETEIQPLKALDFEDGTLPLFMEEDVLTTKKDVKNKHIVHIIDDDKCILKFEVPLVPQFNKSERHPKIQEQNDRFNIQIQYIGNKLFIEIRDSNHKNETSIAKNLDYQLTLF